MANERKTQLAKFEEVIQCALLPDEVDKVVAYITTADDILELMEVLASQGYEVTFRYDALRKNYSVCVKGAITGCVNAGKWLYGNGDTSLTAFCSAFYKHFEIYKQEKWTHRSTGSSLGVS